MAKKEKDEMGIDEPEKKVEPPRLRQNLPAPKCPYCKDEDGKPVVCKHGRAEAYFSRYYCPTPGCTYSQKVPRPMMDARLAAARAAEDDFSAR